MSIALKMLTGKIKKAGLEVCDVRIMGTTHSFIVRRPGGVKFNEVVLTRVVGYDDVIKFTLNNNILRVNTARPNWMDNIVGYLVVNLPDNKFLFNSWVCSIIDEINSNHLMVCYIPHTHIGFSDGCARVGIKLECDSAYSMLCFDEITPGCVRFRINTRSTKMCDIEKRSVVVADIIAELHADSFVDTSLYYNSGVVGGNCNTGIDVDIVSVVGGYKVQLPGVLTRDQVKRLLDSI